MSKCGIYKIVNIINGKCYVGSSNNIPHRWKYHVRLLNENRHDNDHLQNSWNKHGKHSFQFLIIEEVPEKDLLIVEQKHLNVCKSYPNLYYNISYDATAPMKDKIPWNKGKKGLQISWNKGLEFSEESKRKMSISAKKRMSNPKNNPMFGKTHSEKTREKLRLAWKSRTPVSRETRIKMSISQKQRFNKL